MRSAVRDTTMVRPKLDDPRCCQLNLHLTKAEFVTVEARASAEGLEVRDYGRRRLLGGGVGCTVRETPVALFDRLAHIQLRRLGNLLNQLVRHLHQTGEVLPDAAALLKDIRAILSGAGP